MIIKSITVSLIKSVNLFDLLTYN